MLGVEPADLVDISNSLYISLSPVQQLSWRDDLVEVTHLSDTRIHHVAPFHRYDPLGGLVGRCLHTDIEISDRAYEESASILYSSW